MAGSKEVKNMKGEHIGANDLANKLIDFVVLPSSIPGMINEKSLFHRALSHFIAFNQPIQIAGFIGQGGKDHLGKSDRRLLEKYVELQKGIKRYYSVGAEINLIGADLHGLANGISDLGYLDLMQVEANRLGLNWITLSNLYAEQQLALPNQSEASRQLYYQEGSDYEAWLKIPAEIRTNLIKQAEKHRISDPPLSSADYQESGSVFRFSAFYYFLMRKNEEKLFIPDWENYLFVINGSEQLAEHTFPKTIPQMFWYETRHHGGRKSLEKNGNFILPPPWFRND